PPRRAPLAAPPALRLPRRPGARLHALRARLVPWARRPQAGQVRAVSRLNWDDPAAVALWLRGLRESFSDFDSAASDMLSTERKRRLGPVTHASLYKEARAQIRMALDYATPEPERGDPAGSGGAGAE